MSKHSEPGVGSASKWRLLWLGLALIAAALIGGFLVIQTGINIMYGWTSDEPRSSISGARRDIAAGELIYQASCAACHGASLQGQPDWRSRKADGRLPAPPHNEQGHTWHHTDTVLFLLTMNGLVPPLVPAGYESDMPAFKDILTEEEIWQVLAYIKSTWPEQSVEYQQLLNDDAAAIGE